MINTHTNTHACPHTALLYILDKRIVYSSYVIIIDVSDTTCNPEVLLSNRIDFETLESDCSGVTRVGVVGGKIRDEDNWNWKNLRRILSLLLYTLLLVF